jgi:hypothetical protein
MTPRYTIIRVNEAVLGLDRATLPYGVAAIALLNRDRVGSQSPGGLNQKQP